MLSEPDDTEIKMLGDFHIHSTFSDGCMSIPEIVDYFGSRGFGAIAITDHLCESETVIGRAAHYMDRTLTRENFPKYIETIRREGERALDQYGMVVIPGYEITKNSLSNHRSAHILVLGLEEFLPADGDIVETAKKAVDLGGITVAAHPVFTKHWEKQTFHLWDRRQEIEPYIHAWEATRGVKILEKVSNSGLPMIANSDLHRPSHITSWKTIVHSEQKSEAVLEAIRKQKVDFQIFREEDTSHHNLFLQEAG